MTSKKNLRRNHTEVIKVKSAWAWMSADFEQVACFKLVLCRLKYVNSYQGGTVVLREMQDQRLLVAPSTGGLPQQKTVLVD